MKDHLEHVALHPCCICGDPFTVVAHHVTVSEGGELNAMGAKASDFRTVPLCHMHHGRLHTWRDGERNFWLEHCTDPEAIIEQMVATSPVAES